MIHPPRVRKNNKPLNINHYACNKIADSVAGGGVEAGDTAWQVFDRTGRRKYVSANERARFLEQTQRLSPPDRALCRLLALTGCRVSEALALQRCQIDAERSVVTFRTLKRRRLAFRTVPVPADLCLELLALPDREGAVWSMHRVTAWRHVRATATITHIQGPMACPRGLRHGFGIHAATSKVPLNLIQRWMGHASMTTTAIYVDAVGSEERGFAERMW